jgi:hypothetical protein
MEVLEGLGRSQVQSSIMRTDCENVVLRV